jgi:hypothetical protein
MTKTLIRASLLSIVLSTGGIAFADVTAAQTHHCKLPDGSTDLKKTRKECATAKGEWAADAAKPPAATARPVAPVAPAAPAKPVAPVTPAPTAGNAQDHHCRMPDKSMDLKKTHKECEAAKGEWAKDASGTTSAAVSDTQDHHCRMPDKTIDLKKTHKECEAAKGEWAKDASKPATAPHAP